MVTLDLVGSVLFCLILWGYMDCETPKERAIVLAIDFALVVIFDLLLDGAPSRGYF